MTLEVTSLGDRGRASRSTCCWAAPTSAAASGTCSRPARAASGSDGSDRGRDRAGLGGEPRLADLRADRVASRVPDRVRRPVGRAVPAASAGRCSASCCVAPRSPSARTGTATRAWQRTWTRVFGVASIVAPFLLGAAAASIASGRIRDRGRRASTPGSSRRGPPAVALRRAVRGDDLRVPRCDVPDRRGGAARRGRAGAGLPGPGDRAGASSPGMLAAVGPAPRSIRGARALGRDAESGLRSWPCRPSAGVVSLAAMVRPLSPRARPPPRRRRRRPVGLGRGSVAVLIVPDVTAARRPRPATLRVVAIGFTVGGAVLAPSLSLLFRSSRPNRSRICGSAAPSGSVASVNWRTKGKRAALAAVRPRAGRSRRGDLPASPSPPPPPSLA